MEPEARLRASSTRYGEIRGGRPALRFAPCGLQIWPRRRVGAKRHRWPRPARRCFRHDGRMAHGDQPAETGIGFFQPIAYRIETGVRAGEAVDAAELAQPVAGLRE